LRCVSGCPKAQPEPRRLREAGEAEDRVSSIRAHDQEPGPYSGQRIRTRRGLGSSMCPNTSRPVSTSRRAATGASPSMGFPPVPVASLGRSAAVWTQAPSPWPSWLAGFSSAQPCPLQWAKPAADVGDLLPRLNPRGQWDSGGRFVPVPDSKQPGRRCAWQESNLRPRAPEARALSPELQALGGQV
jgi:hypothetical protein